MLDSRASEALAVIDQLLADAEDLAKEERATPYEYLARFHKRIERWADHASRQIGRHVSQEEGDRAAAEIGFPTGIRAIVPDQFQEDFEEAIGYLEGLREAVKRDPTLVSLPVAHATQPSPPIAPPISEEDAEAIRLYTRWRKLIDVAEWVRKDFADLAALPSTAASGVWRFFTANRTREVLGVLSAIGGIIGGVTAVVALL